MSTSTIACVIAGTYAVLLLLWLVSLPFARRAFARDPVLIDPAAASPSPRTPSEVITSAGVLLVFMANIATVGFFLAAPVWPEVEGFLQRARLELPPLLNAAGAVGFVAYGIGASWCWSSIPPTLLSWSADTGRSPWPPGARTRSCVTPGMLRKPFSMCSCSCSPGCGFPCLGLSAGRQFIARRWPKNAS